MTLTYRKETPKHRTTKYESTVTGLPYFSSLAFASPESWQRQIGLRVQFRKQSHGVSTSMPSVYSLVLLNLLLPKDKWNDLSLAVAIIFTYKNPIPLKMTRQENVIISQQCKVGLRCWWLHVTTTLDVSPLRECDQHSTWWIYSRLIDVATSSKRTELNPIKV